MFLNDYTLKDRNIAIVVFFSFPHIVCIFRTKLLTACNFDDQAFQSIQLARSSFSILIHTKLSVSEPTTQPQPGNSHPGERGDARLESQTRSVL